MNYFIKFEQIGFHSCAIIDNEESLNVIDYKNQGFIELTSICSADDIITSVGQENIPPNVDLNQWFYQNYRFFLSANGDISIVNGYDSNNQPILVKLCYSGLIIGDSTDTVQSDTLLLRQKLIKEIKEEGNMRIRNVPDMRLYSKDEWILKSQNFQDIKTNYGILLSSGISPTSEQISEFNLAKNVLARKDRYVLRVNEIESNLQSMSLELLNTFSAKDNANWEGLD